MEYQFTHSKTFRYQTLNEEFKPKKVLYVLHGYGQLVEFFIRKFRDIGKEFLIVAPEGMHRFYLQGASGRVGASWMTKEARETDIADNLGYLDTLDEMLSKEYKFEERYLLGFSQGGATAARWNKLGNSQFEAMILWACVFPPDLPQEIESNERQANYFVIGDEDEFFSQDDQEKLISEYLSKNYNIKRYRGKHDIFIDTLREILDEISNK